MMIFACCAVQVRLTSLPGSVPRLDLDIHLPGSEEAAAADCVFEQLFKQLYGTHSLTRVMDADTQPRLWKVRMQGKGAAAEWTDDVDAGGPFRASVQMLCADALQRNRPHSTVAGEEQPVALLIPTPNFENGVGEGEDSVLRYVPNPLCKDAEDLDRFRFLGQMCGASARYSAFIELDLPAMVWKSLLGERLDVHDIRGVDARTAAHLDIVAPPECEDPAAEAAAAKEWATKQESQTPVQWCLPLLAGSSVALRGDGSDLVTHTERGVYNELAQEAWLEQFQPQLEAMRLGCFSCFPELAARLLTWRDFEQRCCGRPDVAVSALQQIARYEGSHRADSPYIRQFWEVLASFTGLERKKFLGFCWGRGRLPAHTTQPFVIDSGGGADDAQLPTTHTCMFQLHLPRYSSKALLRQRLLTAITMSGAQNKAEAAQPLAASLVEGQNREGGMRRYTTPSFCLWLPQDVGHRESLDALFERCGLQHIKSAFHDRCANNIETVLEASPRLFRHMCLNLLYQRLYPPQQQQTEELRPRRSLFGLVPGHIGEFYVRRCVYRFSRRETRGDGQDNVLDLYTCAYGTTEETTIDEEIVGTGAYAYASQDSV
jgi:hypothetical protein